MDQDPFALLNPGIQRWIYREGWAELRDVQAEAIGAIVAGGEDVLISAPTAAGKTEAAFLPLLSRAMVEEKAGVRALYVGPLKALINDQFARLETLCEDLEFPVHRWHGDVGAAQKVKVRENPSGVVLITPESLEALFVRYGTSIRRMFAGLEGVVVDEVHSFIGTERGAQLQSLLHRLEDALARTVVRIGLSATLGEPRLAAEFLRPGGSEKVRVVVSNSGAGAMRALIVGVQNPPLESRWPDAVTHVADHLYGKMRGKHNLVFANSRNRVEELGDLLIQRCQSDGVPEEFGAHHGSLSKEIRYDAEQRLKDGRPFTVVCTSTLEMGIDIGNMNSIGQVGIPPSVASLRQRLGRSGRRKGEVPTIWIYAMEDALGEGSHLLDRLRKGLFQQAAMLELILSRWCEAPRDEALHLSTLVQQCLSVVAERGGISPSSLYRLLCRGPFARVDRERFVQFLRVMGEQKILVSAEDGSLLAGEAGERMLAHYSFYAAFATTEEYRIVCDGKTLGTLPIEGPVLVDGTIVFAARRWRVDSIDESVRVIQVKRAETGKAPVFGSEEHYGYREEIRIRMRSLYEQVSVPPYLDEGARRLWGQGQTEYTMRNLESNSIVAEGTGSVLFLWDSDHAALTLSALLGTLGISAEGDGFALEIESVRPSDVQSALKALAREPNWPTGYELAQRIGNKELEKHDRYLGPDLLAWEYAAKMFDIPGARRLVTRLTQSR